MQHRAVLFLTAGIFALGSTLAIAQGHGGGGGGSAGGAGAYHGGGGGNGYHGGGYYGGHYGYGYHGYYGGWGGWYGPGVGIYLGAPWWGWGFAGYPYYPYAGAVPYPAYAAADPAYVTPDPVYGGSYQSHPESNEQQPYTQQAPAPTAYWYYCADPAGYYPYVQRCQAGWMRVAPQNVPPGQ